MLDQVSQFGPTLYIFRLDDFTGQGYSCPSSCATGPATFGLRAARSSIHASSADLRTIQRKPSWRSSPSPAGATRLSFLAENDSNGSKIVWTKFSVSTPKE
jgi:hypothetical protein